MLTPYVAVSVQLTLKKGKYHIIPCTFEANKESSFVLKSSYGKLKAITPWNYQRVEGSWDISTAGGCKNHKTFKNNPQFLVKVEEETPISATVCHNEENFDSIAFYVYKSESGAKLEKFLPKDQITKSPFVDEEEESTSFIDTLPSGTYSFIPCTFSPEKEGSFKIQFYSKKPLTFIESNEPSSDSEEDEDVSNKSEEGSDVRKATGTSSALAEEKRKHLATIQEMNEMRSELSATKETIRTLHQKIEALTGGQVKGSDDLTVPGSLLKDFVLQMNSLQKENEALSKKNKDWEKEKEKTLNLLKKVEAMLPSSESNTSTPTTPEWRETAEEVVGKEVAIYGSWKGSNAGGCMNYTTWRNNPQIFLTVPTASTQVTITLNQEDKNGTTQIGFYLIQPEVAQGKRVLYLEEGESDIAAKAKFSSSRSNKLDLTLPKTNKYPYVIIPCTFKAGEERNWTLTISSSEEVRAVPFSSKSNNWHIKTIKDSWTDETAGGCKNNASFVDNPQYLIRVDKDDTPLRVLLLQHELESFDTISTYLIRTQDGDGKQVKLSKIDNKDIVCKGEFGSDTESYVTTKLSQGNYVLIPCTFDKGQKASYELNIYSTSTFSVEELSSAQVAVVQGEWKDHTAGGCLNDIVSFKHNTQYLLTLKKDLDLVFKLQQQPLDASGTLNAIGYYVFTSNGKRKFKVRKNDTVAKDGFMKTKELVGEHTLKAEDSPFIVVPCTLNSKEEGHYKLSIASKNAGVDFSNDMSFGPVPLVYKEMSATSKWDEHHSGGCLNYTTWVNNPQFLFTTDKKSEVVIYLNTNLDDETLKTFSGIGFYVVRMDPNSTYRLELNPKDILKKASFRKSKEVMVRFQAEPGSYNIIASTFRPGYFTDFQVTVFSDNMEGSTLEALENANITFDGCWDKNNAGGNTRNYEKWITNPRYYITVKKPMKLGLTLVQENVEESENYPAIGFTVTPTDGEGNPLTSKASDLLAVAGFETERDISAAFELQPSVDPYVVIPTTFDPDIHRTFSLALQFDPSNASFVEFLDVVPKSLEGDEDQFKAEVLLSKLQKCINNTSLSSIDLVQLIDSAGLTFLSSTAHELQAIAAKLQTVLNALKAPELFSSDELETPVEEVEVTPPTGDVPPPPIPPVDGTPQPPPPPPPSSTTTSSQPTSIGDSITKGVALKKTSAPQETTQKYSNPQEEMLSIIKSGRAQLKSASNRKLKEKPVEKDLFCSFNMEMLSRRRAFEDETDDHEDDDDDWD